MTKKKADTAIINGEHCTKRTTMQAKYGFTSSQMAHMERIGVLRPLRDLLNGGGVFYNTKEVDAYLSLRVSTALKVMRGEMSYADARRTVPGLVRGSEYRSRKIDVTDEL